MSIFSITLILVRKILDKYADSFDKLEIPITDLKPGMLLHKDTIEMLKLEQQLDCIGPLYPDGLTKDQVRKLKEMGLEKVSIQKTSKFAYLIFAGFAISIVTGKNLLSLLM